MAVFVIAEAGSCHEGILNNAKRLIDLAYAVGCDAVKFQYCSSYAALAKKRNTEIKYPFSIPRESLPYLQGYCGDRIEFMCSCYLKEDIEVVAPFVKKFKVAAYESEDLEFLEAHPHDRPLLVSNGSYNLPHEYNLYCISLYPCPDEKIHLLGDDENDNEPARFGMPEFEGLSDHTKNPLTGALAVALGAKYIEFHIKLKDTSENCPDFSVARTPEEAHIYVRNIRSAEVLLG